MHLFPLVNTCLFDADESGDSEPEIFADNSDEDPDFTPGVTRRGFRIQEWFQNLNLNQNNIQDLKGFPQLDQPVAAGPNKGRGGNTAEKEDIPENSVEIPSIQFDTE